MHLGFYVIGACMYDVWQYFRQHMRLHDSTKKYRPQITVLVPAHNEEKVIVRCLDSIFVSTYPRLRVMVVNDASTDSTEQLVNQYRHAHPDQQLSMLSELLNIGKGAALNHALKDSVSTELVMMLDADSLLAPNAIEKAVSYFANSRVVGVAANVQIINQHTTLGMLQKFEHMVSYQSKKAYSITNCDYIIGGVGSTYRTKAIRAVNYYDTDTMTEDISLSMKLAAQGNRENRLLYGADVVALTEPVDTFSTLARQRYRWKYGSLQNLVKHSYLIDANSRKYSNMLTMYRLPMAIVTEMTLLLLPLVWLYGFYITLSERSLTLIAGAYLLISIYTLLTLWYNTYLRWQERLQLAIYVPIMYFLFYIMDVVQIAAIIRCIVRAPQLLRREHVASTWVSPARLGNRLSTTSVSTSSTTAEESHE